MNKIMKPLLLFASIIGFFFLLGCNSSQQSSEPAHQGQAKPIQNRSVNEREHDSALKHFIEGAALDAKGSFAEAILEYQEALQSEPNASIYYAISKDYLLLGKFDRASENANKAVALEPLKRFLPLESWHNLFQRLKNRFSNTRVRANCSNRFKL